MNAPTFFRKNCVWMHLKSLEELEWLKDAMNKYDFHGKILSIEETYSDNFGHRITVCILRPGNSQDQNAHPLYGENYRKWECIKSTIYRKRKALA